MLIIIFSEADHRGLGGHDAVLLGRFVLKKKENPKVYVCGWKAGYIV